MGWSTWVVMPLFLTFQRRGRSSAQPSHGCVPPAGSRCGVDLMWRQLLPILNGMPDIHAEPVAEASGPRPGQQAGAPEAVAAGQHRSEKRLPGLSLRARLVVIGLVGIVLNLVVVESALAGLDRVQRSNRLVDQLGRAQRYQQDVELMDDTLHAVFLEALLAGRGHGPDSKETLLGEVAVNAERFRRDLGLLQSLDLGGPTGAELRRVRPAQDAYVADAERLSRLAFRDPDAADAAHAVFNESFDALEGASLGITDGLQRATDQAVQEAAREQTAAQRRILGASAASLVGLLLLSFMLSRLGHRLAVVMGQLRAGARRQQFASQLAEALEIADTEADAYRIMEQAMEHVSPVMPTELLLADSSEAQLERVAASPAAGSPGCPVQSPWGCMAVRRASAITFESSQALNACPKLRDRPGGPHSATCVPLSFMGRSLGVLHATGPDGAPPGPAEVEQLVTMAAQAGSRLGTLRAFQRTELQAATDALTGLMNRRTMENRVQAMLAAKRPFALAMADLDHFKRLNDTHGHAAGDRALRLFARTISDGIRDADLFARYGGEEFVLVLPGLSVAEAVDVLERQRTILAGALAAAGSPSFTVSFGVTDSTAGATLDDMLRTADAGLLQAKSSGRDRVVVAGAGSSPHDHVGTTS
ncbi:MAG TPA: sensor domain-containing diguanylate cyclase [Actinomycetes bacterium]